MKRVLCFGEILWDVIGDGRYLGGAPLNAAADLVKLGVAAAAVSAVGGDALGRETLARLAGIGVDTSLVATDPVLSTGTALVHPERDGGDRFELPFPVAYDRIPFDPAAAGPAPDGLIWGTLAAHRSGTTRASLRRLIAAYPGAVSLYDVNLRKDLYSRALIEELASACTVFKLNEGEAEVLAPLLFGEALDVPAFAARCLAAFGCRWVVVTRGADGAEGFSAEGAFRAAAEPAEVVDTVGAGDAFSAGVMSVLLNGGDLPAALAAGTARGAACVRHAGAF